MRSNRSSNIDNENRRNDYHYHHASRSSQAHVESNGHASNQNSEYRSSKRSSHVVINNNSTSLIKRMKSSNSVSSTNSVSNNTKETNRDIKSKISVPNSTTSFSITPSECHQISYNAYEAEEKEALVNTDINSDVERNFDNFSDATHSLKKLILDILEAKKCKKENSPKEDSNKNLFDDFKVKGLLHLIEMKNMNRIDKFRLKEARKNLISAKDKVDQIHLQLQNLQYEVMHLQKEQKTCASFRSKDESLELVQDYKFYLSDHIPKDLQHLIVISDDKKIATIDRANATNEQLHQLHLARLDWELKQRICSEEELKLAEESRFRLEVEISSKKRNLAQFEPTLRKIIDSSKPLVTQLNVPLQVYNTSHNLTPFLPQPLYVLYIQLCAYKSAFGVNYDVSIKGSEEEAKEFEACLKKETNAYIYNHGEKFDDDDEHGQIGDDDDEEIELRSKSKKSRYHHHNTANAKADKEDPQVMDISLENKDCTNESFLQLHSKLLQSHPIKVNLMFRYRHYHMTCTFTYFPKLELIGLNYNIDNVSHSHSVDSNFSVSNYDSNIFSKLFSSSDTGHKCPNLMIEYILRKAEIESFDKLFPYIGFTYDWAQRMAGIEYLNPEEKPILSSGGIIRVKSSIAIDSLDKTIKAMSFRFQSRINLQEQLLEVQTKKYIDTSKFESLLDSNEMFDNLNKISLKPKSTIELFERLTTEKFLTEMNIYSIKKSKLIEYFDYGINDNSNESANDIFDENNFIFKTQVQGKLDVQIENFDKNYNLVAYIIVPHNFPEKWPFFILSFDLTANQTKSYYLESNWLRSLEEHINVRLPIKVYEQAKNIEESLYSTTLLLRQIYDLQCGLDVIIDARKKLSHKANESLEVYSGPRCVNSFLSMSIIQGRDHSLKFE